MKIEVEIVQQHELDEDFPGGAYRTVVNTSEGLNPIFYVLVATELLLRVVESAPPSVKGELENSLEHLHSIVGVQRDH